MKPKILVIVGPTASGKSGLAVKLAKKFKGEVISADSRQVYKGLNVGTGKISKKEMQSVKHHLLDIADPKKQFSASDYKKLAENCVRYIVRHRRLPIVVGGTGFYIDALARAQTFPDVPPNKSLRDRLNKLTKDKLLSMLKRRDPARAKSIDPNNKVRLIRALEIVEALGKVPAIPMFSRTPEYQFTYIGLKPEKEELDKKIYERLDKRIPGIIKEVKKLHESGLSWKRMHELGLEYRYVSQFVQGKLDKDEMTEKLYSEIRHYAKRQMTWFKRNKNIKWFEPIEYKAIEKYARIALNRGD